MKSCGLYEEANAIGVKVKNKAEQKEKQMKEELAYYELLMKSGQKLKMRFTISNSDGSLYKLTDTGLILEYSDMDLNNERKDNRYRLSLEYNVTVCEICSEKRVVKLAPAGTEAKRALLLRMKKAVEEQRPRLDGITRRAKKRLKELQTENEAQLGRLSEEKQKTICKEIYKGLWAEEWNASMAEQLTVPVVVVSVASDYLVVDVMGKGVYASVSKHDWGYTNISSLSHIVEVGEVTEIVIKNYAYKTEVYDEQLGKIDVMFCGTRLPLIENPWKTQILHKDDIVRLKCIDVKSHNWFGGIEGTELQIYGEYPEKTDGIRIVPGELYDCRIYMCNLVLHNVKARAIRHVREKEDI